MPEALNLYRDLSKYASKMSDVTSLKVVETFKDCQRFVLPINGLILDNGGKALDEILRLPYPKISMEFESEVDETISTDHMADQMDKMSFVGNIYDRHIVFAEETADGKIRVQLSSKFRKSGQYKFAWNTVPFILEMHRALEDGHVVQANVIPTHAKALQYQNDQVSWHEIGLTLLKPAFKAVAELIEALTCSNVKAEKSNNPKRLQGRRPGELPYDDYHELVVTAHGFRSESEGGDGTSGIKRREHLRRGHIRNYKSGLKVWVQAHVVNAGAAGKIEKHYKLKPTKGTK